MNAGRRWWVADDEPNQRFTLYSRGNVGEVFPHVITALTGTLIGEAVRDGQVGLFSEMGVLRAHEIVGPSVSTGVFGGYLYMNASVMRLFASRMPGMSIRDADEQVMGNIPDVPPHRRSKGDRNALATLRLMKFSMTLMRRPDLVRLDSARDEARAWIATMPEFSTATDRELLAWLSTFLPRQRASMTRLLRSSSIAGALRGLLDRAVSGERFPAGLANRIVSGTGDIDSAQLPRQLWALGRLVAADAELTQLFNDGLFDDGLGDIATRSAHTPLHAAVKTFLGEYGHRGNNEYELAAPAWVMDPAPVYAAIDRLRNAPEERDPVAAGDRLAADAQRALADALTLVRRPARAMVRRLAHSSRTGAIGRERAKDILVLENLGARLVLHELLRRAADRGGTTDMRRAFCVTADELAEYVADPARFAGVIDERFERQQYLNDRLPPLWFDGHIPDPATWQTRSDARSEAPALGATLRGIAASGGMATGPARVIHDPGDPQGLEPGDVLVCAITDPSWTPLFLAAAAVVCDAGAVQSHAAIVARELGIPAVLSVSGITSIADGTILHVDGTAGTVTIG